MHVYVCTQTYRHTHTHTHTHTDARTYGAGKAHSTSSVNLKATEADAIGE